MITGTGLKVLFMSMDFELGGLSASFGGCHAVPDRGQADWHVLTALCYVNGCV